jgi:Na+/proline symporter
VAFEARRQAAHELASVDDVDAAAWSAARDEFRRADAAVREIRSRASAVVKTATGKTYADVNYVFPSFVIERMPIGLVGLIIAAIFAAAMSSIAAELNALATASVIDVYKRHVNPNGTDAQYLRMSKIATALWGLFACVAAVYAVEFGSLIEVVNRYGSYFYGSILGVFILAIGTKRANGHGAFFGLIGGMAVVWLVAENPFTWGWMPRIVFLWWNVLGAIAVVVIGMAVSALTEGQRLEVKGQR